MKVIDSATRSNHLDPIGLSDHAVSGTVNESTRFLYDNYALPCN